MPDIGIGFHTDAFNSSHKSFEQALAWAQENGVRYIEPGVIEGACWIHGLGYFPHISLIEDPALLRRKMERYDVRVLPDRRRVSAVGPGRHDRRRSRTCRRRSPGRRWPAARASRPPTGCTSRKGSATARRWT